MPLSRYLMFGRKPSQNLMRLAGDILCLLLLATPAVAQQSPPGLASGWQQWFFAQRTYGLGYIPDGALANALAQRNAAQAAAFSRASTSDENGTPAVTSQWLSIGPAGINSSLGMVSGKINSLAVNPASSSNLYLAAADGGVWESTNQGVSWSPLTDQLPSLSSGAVAIDPFSGNVWYGTGELNFCSDCYYGAGVFMSSNGGTNWTQVNPTDFLSSPTSVIVFDPNNQGTLFIGRSTALWKSTDGGQTWNAVLDGAITDFVIDPADSSICYAAVGYYTGSSSNGIYQSTDGGNTWTLLSAGLPAQSTIGRIALGIAPSQPSTVYALIARSDNFELNGLFVSNNSGATWSQINTLPADFFNDANGGHGALNLVMKVSPVNPSVIYVGNVTLFESTDAGNTWADITSEDFMPGYPQDLVFDPENPQTLYVIGDSGIWSSSDGGQTFSSLNLTLAINELQSVALHPTNPEIALTGTEATGLAFFSGSSIWQQALPGYAGASFYDPTNPLVIYSSGGDFQLSISMNGGQVFSQINSSLSTSGDRVLFYPPVIPDPNTSGVLYFGTQRVWQSVDYGNDWKPISTDLTNGGSAVVSALAVAPSNSQVLWAGTSDGNVQVSTNGGTSWFEFSSASFPDRYVTAIAIEPPGSCPNPGACAVVGVSGFDTGHIFQTQNYGETWTDIDSNLPDIPVDAILLDGNNPNTIYLGTDIGVFVLASNGTWTPLQNGLPNAPVLALAQNTTTGLLVAATHGRGVFAIASGGAASSAPVMSLALNSAGLQPGSLAAGMLATLFGTNLAASTVSVSTLPLPTSAGGASLLINGVPAPLSYVSPTQINFQVPFGLTGSTATVSLTTAAGQATMQVPLIAAQPGIFANGSTGDVFHGNGTLVSSTAPAQPGEELVLFGSGLGAVNQPVVSGAAAPFSPPAETVVTPSVLVGGTPAGVEFSGLTPSAVGLYQINFTVPAGPSGAVPLVVQIGNAVSNTVVLNVSP